jgi:hypothetical protein
VAWVSIPSGPLLRIGLSASVSRREVYRGPVGGQLRISKDGARALVQDAFGGLLLIDVAKETRTRLAFPFDTGDFEIDGSGAGESVLVTSAGGVPSRIMLFRLPLPDAAR